MHHCLEKEPFPWSVTGSDLHLNLDSSWVHTACFWPLWYIQPPHSWTEYTTNHSAAGPIHLLGVDLHRPTHSVVLPERPHLLWWTSPQPHRGADGSRQSPVKLTTQECLDVCPLRIQHFIDPLQDLYPETPNILLHCTHTFQKPHNHTTYHWMLLVWNDNKNN